MPAPRPHPALKPFHPIVRRWFAETLGKPSEPQLRGWPTIASGAHTLILAPTGTGKTLTAFLWELNALLVEGMGAPLANAVHILYVSPLKALNNDIQRNLEGPLAQLAARFDAAGEKFPEVRVAVRTGDTPPSARARMLRKSPHILITTPESLHLMLTSLKGRGMFSMVRAVIVDEIHALAGSKRGAHLALTLERLDARCEHAPQRIGLSATQRPLEEIARFLGGQHDDGAPRLVSIVDCGLVKKAEVTVRSPVPDLGHVGGGTVWPHVAPLVLAKIQEANTTIVFVNNRAQAERMAARVNALAGQEPALPYHGSLSRERRMILERQLKAGELRALVSTSALELGIDVGSVDLVLQLQSPKRVAAGLQRVGRAGHTITAVSRGVFVPTFRDDAMETLAIVAAMKEGDVEPTRVVQNALDVLAQVLVAAVAVDDDWTSAGLFALVRRSYPYHRLARTAFEEVLEMLSGKYPSDVASELDARMLWDRATDRLAPARSARLVATMNAGTIPDRGLYTVNLPDRTRLGELDEEFVHETRIGDAFQLGSSTWRVQAIEHDRVIVVPAPGAPARMPFWHGEYGAHSSHLAPRIGALRRELADVRTLEQVRGMADRYGSDEETITSMTEYVQQQRAATGVVPDDRVVLVEHYRDEVGSVRVVLHAPFGGRVNAPWGMALRQRLVEGLAGARGARDGREIPPHEIQVLTTDDGILLRLPDLGGAPPLDFLRDLGYAEAETRVIDEVGSSSLFGARFRMNAARALLLPRGNPRRRMPLWLQRLKALDLLQTVRDFPSFPILVETYRDVLQDAFDMPALREVLASIADGRIAVRTAATEVASPFSSSLQFGFVMDWMYADDAPRAEQRAAILSLDRAMLDELLGEEGADEGTIGALDEMLARRRGTAPDRQARTADELAILLDRAGDLTDAEVRARIAAAGERPDEDPLGALLAAGRATRVAIPVAGGVEERVILVESWPRYLAVFGDALGSPPAAVPAALRGAVLTPEAARRELLVRFIALASPFTLEDVLARYDLDPVWLELRLQEWQKQGRLVRGLFGGVAGASRWASRRLVEQARRRELAAMRKQIRAVALPRFAQFLVSWQHADPGGRLRGSEGAAAIVRQMYGLARPADEWERNLLPSRVENASLEDLTMLSVSGELTWIGDSGRREDGSDTLKGIRFVQRGTERAWSASREVALSEGATLVRDALERGGASFFPELQVATALGTPGLRDALRELVSAGLATNDTMDAMRMVARWKPATVKRTGEADPTRWLPEGFTPRPVVQRRANLRRLPKWRRPDQAGGERAWPGRWSLVRAIELDEEAAAALVARQWLERYGVVSRDWWRMERPAIGWRMIYRELKRLEFRGDVRRGYFVEGLGGAQFALPHAVELLRAEPDAQAEMFALASTDPANPYALPRLPGVARDALTQPRGRGALLVLRAGEVMLSSESRGRRVRVRAELSDTEVADAARAFATAYVRSGSRRTLDVERIDDMPATMSPHREAFELAGFRRTPGTLRLYPAAL